MLVLGINLTIIDTAALVAQLRGAVGARALLSTGTRASQELHLAAAVREAVQAILGLHILMVPEGAVVDIHRNLLHRHREPTTTPWAPEALEAPEILDRTAAQAAPAAWSSPSTPPAYQTAR